MGPRASGIGGAHSPEGLAVGAAHRDKGENRIAEEKLADRALLLEELQAGAAFLALADRDRIHHRVDADELVDIVLEPVDVLDRESHMIHSGRQDALAGIALYAPRDD